MVRQHVREVVQASQWKQNVEIAQKVQRECSSDFATTDVLLTF
jgi:hypothetical protein